MHTVSDSAFNELRQQAKVVWQSYDDTYGYASEKIAYLNSFENVKDNYGTIIGMFDHLNQRKLYDAVGVEGKKAIDLWVGGLERVEKLAKDMGL